MDFWHILFWLCAGCVGYVFVGYPLILAIVGTLSKRPWRVAPFTGSISIVLAARNEAQDLERRLRELVGLIKAGPWWAEIVVVSDGSTDATVAIAKSHATSGLVRVLALPQSEGKAAALTKGCLACQSDVLAFADVRQRWEAETLERLLGNFADSDVGAVSGDLQLEAAPGIMAGVGFYWRFEKWLRRRESVIDSQVGVTGAIAAVRRELFRPIPPGTLLDDVYWPLQVAMEGYRVVHDAGARAFDRLPDDPRDEFRRKVRTLAGNFQLMTLMPSSLLPWRNPVWVQWISRKLLRLVAPWALLGLFACSMGGDGLPFRLLLGVQLFGCSLAILGLFRSVGGKLPLAGAAASFVMLNTAAFTAFWVWISGRAGRSWSKIDYCGNEERPPGNTRRKNEERRIRNSE